MIFKQPIEYIEWNDFFAGKISIKKRKEEIKCSHLFLQAITLGAQMGLDEKIARAFNPIIEIAQGLCYPISILMIIWGLILYGLDNRQMGIQKIKSGIILYLGIHWLPWLMDILSGIAQVTTPR